MDTNKIIYSLSVEDIFTVMEDNDWNMKIKKKDILFIEDKIGDFIGSKWYDAIEFALQQLKDSRK